MRHNLLFILLTTILSFQSRAALLEFSVTIDASQTVPPNGSAGTGTATVTVDDVSNQLCWDISWSGLSGAATAMHFHGPAAAGANAGVQVNTGAISGLTSPSNGCSAITALQITDLANDLWYINIHTAANPGGEIRGQVVETTPVELLQFEIE